MFSSFSAAWQSLSWLTLDPLALRPRLSSGLPLSNDKVEQIACAAQRCEPKLLSFKVHVFLQEAILKKIGGPCTKTRLALTRSVSYLRQPGDHSHVRDFRPVGFASLAFTRFAIVGYFLLELVYNLFPFLRFSFLRCCITDL